MSVTLQFPKLHTVLPQDKKASLQFWLTETFPEKSNLFQGVITVQWHLICHLQAPGVISPGCISDELTTDFPMDHVF